MASLEIYGASITYGIGDSQAGGWAARLRNTMIGRMLDQEPPDKRGIKVHNHARLGMTLPRTVSLLHSHLNHRDGRGRLLVAIMPGFSDHGIPPGTTEPSVPLPKFKANLEAFSSILQGSPFSVIRMFVELPLFDLIRPHPFNPGDINLDRLTEYQEAVRSHATNTGAHYIEIAHILQDLQDQGHDTISHDGIHPNVLGHTIIHDVVLREVDEIVGPRTIR